MGISLSRSVLRGSCRQAFALRDAGAINLDDPVTKYLPGFSVLSAGWRTRARITLRDLASHTSGLPREIPFPCGDFRQGCNESLVLELLAKRAARRDSAEDFSRLNALLCTAMDRILIPAYCFANS